MPIRRSLSSFSSRLEKEGKIKRLPVIRGATKSLTIRMQIADIEAAREIADKRGLPYQTYISGLHDHTLDRERKAG